MPPLTAKPVGEEAPITGKLERKEKFKVRLREAVPDHKRKLTASCLVAQALATFDPQSSFDYIFPVHLGIS